MDDVIIIILTLVLTVVAAINQSKKKRQQQSPSGNEGEPDFWEEILHVQKPAPQPVPPSPQPIRKEPVARKATPEPIKSRTFSSKKAKSQINRSYQQAFNDEGGRNEAILNRTHENTVGSDNLTESFNEESFLEDFSLRKAVIYSEIIKPKYF